MCFFQNDTQLCSGFQVLQNSSDKLSWRIQKLLRAILQEGCVGLATIWTEYIKASELFLL